MSNSKPALTISADQPSFTVINRFLPSPENQAELVDVLVKGISQEMAIQPGFRSAAVHRSTDSNDVLVYAQWDSAEALAAAAEVVKQGGAPNMAHGFDLGQPQYHPYEVSSIILA
jgi:hypothetical protein